MSNTTKNIATKEDGKNALVPKLRFPEFRAAAGFRIMKLNELLFEAKHRNRTLELGPADVLSVSGEHGCVNQIEYMGRSYAGVSVKDYHVVEHGDIVYTKSPLKRNPYGIIKENKGKRGIVSTLYAVYRPLPSCSATYLDHFFSVDYNLNAYLQPIVKKGAKNDMKVNNADVLKGDICAPELPEQQKIAECLSSVDELMAAQAQKLDALKIHKKGLMQQLFPREGETQPRLRFPEFQNAGEWRKVSFGKVLKIASGKGFKASEYSKTGIRLLQIENVGYGATKWNENTIYLPETYATEYPELVLRGGDIVLALNRPVTNDELKIARIQKYEAVSILYQRVGRLEILNSSLCVDFAFQFCRQFIKDFVINKSIGSDQPFISLKDLYAQDLLLPTPDEQQRIADCLTSLDELITAEDKKLDAFKAHKKGLMQQLFPTPDEVEA